MWWIQNKLHYPQLHIMALDLLGIPAMSADIERVFSSSGLLITDRRNRLKEDIIEAVECLKSWPSENANGIIPFKNSEEVDIMLKQLKDQAVENGES